MGALCSVVGLAHAATVETVWPDLARAEQQDARKGVPNNKSLPEFTAPAGQTFVLSLAAAHKGLIRSVQLTDNSRAIALTFDLCELQSSVSGYDARLVNALRAHKARATFFVGGKWMRSHPERAMQLMLDPLFEIGNHAWTHGNFGIMDVHKAEQQIVLTQSMYAQLRAQLSARLQAGGLAHLLALVPEQPKVFRFPYGRMRPETLDLVNRSGLAAIQWDVVGEQFAHPASPDAARQLAAMIQPGSIVLLHANLVPRDTAILVENLLPELEKQGFELVHVSELLQRGLAQTADDGYFSKPGDNRSLDSAFGPDGTGQ